MPVKGVRYEMTVKKARLALRMLLIWVVLLASVTGCGVKSMQENIPQSQSLTTSVTMNLERKGNKGKLFPEEVYKVLIFKFEDYRSESQDKDPLLDIRDEAGLKLFANMINTIEHTSGGPNVAPPFIAEVYCQNHVAVLSLYIGDRKGGERYGGLYINECHTAQSSLITVEDGKAFWDAYGHSLS
jgi:hypothetical protein